MSVMRASSNPVSANTSLAASTRRARVRAPLRERALAGVMPSAVVATAAPSASVLGGVVADLERLGDGAAHDQGLVLVGESLHDLAVGERVGHAFRMREVGAEHQAVGRDAE